MQTIFYETSSFIRHEGNVVDLGAYRQKLAAVSGESWPVDSSEDAGEPCFAPAAPLRLLEPGAETPRPHTTQTQRRRRSVRRFGILLDLCASLAIVILTVTAVVQFVRL